MIMCYKCCGACYDVRQLVAAVRRQLTGVLRCDIMLSVAMLVAMLAAALCSSVAMWPRVTRRDAVAMCVWLSVAMCEALALYHVTLIISR